MQGASSRAGIRHASAWGEAFVAADTLLPFRSESLTREYHRVRSQALLGDAAMAESQAGIQKVSGDLVVELDYANLHLLRYALGAVAGGVYSPAASLPCFHLEIDKGTNRYRFRTCVVNSMTLTTQASAEDPVLVTYNLTAYRVDTSATAFPSITLATPKRVQFGHLAYTRIRDHGGALSSSDNFTLAGMELTLGNNLKTDDMSSADQNGVMEPLRNDFREVGTKLAFPRYDANASTIIGLADADSRVQMAWSFVSGANSILFEFPQGKVTKTPSFPVGGPQVLADEVEIGWYRNEHNTNMSGVPQVRITVA